MTEISIYLALVACCALFAFIRGKDPIAAALMGITLTPAMGLVYVLLPGTRDGALDGSDASGEEAAQPFSALANPA
ncbi:hypothetical protein [Ferrimonas marina]|uniref:Uncharacterized protein n=1 Tax=Ferrimonas marina TaxID=299255 RepID=A0A1M5YQM0_9GAMM|nr:hypothetical protein [Ferrimonas marina]SHI14385.1 hypothetical protein SAMN02745129_4309 [Ferrimonas marina]